MRRPAPAIWTLLLALAVVSGLGGCAAPVPPADPARSPRAEPSDASPARQRAQLRLELALAYHQQGQHAVALEETRQALIHDPRWAPAWSLQGLIHLHQGHWPQAQDSLERALALEPRDADAAHNLGWMWCQHPQPRWAQAESLFKRSLALPGAQPAKTWVALGLCQQRAGRLPQAEASLRQALVVEPGSARATWPLSQVLYAQGRWPESAQALAELHARQGASAESLWLAVRLARKLDNAQAFRQAAQQLRQEFGQSQQAQALDKGWFDE